MRRIPVLALAALSLSGCLSVSWEVEKAGSPQGVLAAFRLEPGRSTLRDTLALMGPPDLILQVGQINRLYYVAWGSDYVKLIVSAPIPIVGKRSLDAFIVGFGSEDMRMVRLEFDGTGMLRTLQRGDFQLSRNGESVAVDNRMLEGFIEDRGRTLLVVEKDEDDEDLDEPRKK